MQQAEPGGEGSAMSVHPETEVRILVVDDEPAIVRLLVRALRAAGYSQIRGSPTPLKCRAISTPSLPIS